MKKFPMNEEEMMMQNEEASANNMHFMMRNHIMMNLTLFPCMTKSDVDGMMQESSIQKPQWQLSTQPKFRMG